MCKQQAVVLQNAEKRKMDGNSCKISRFVISRTNIVKTCIHFYEFFKIRVYRKLQLGISKLTLLFLTPIGKIVVLFQIFEIS